MTTLTLNNNIFITNQSEISKAEEKFYQSLYKSYNTKNDLQASFFQQKFIMPLTYVDRPRCEGLVSEDECLEALKNLKNSKSAGTDGLSAEFYKFFWPD